MPEKRILIASLLKPVNDTRMYEKLGRSLAMLPDVQVHICGFEAALPADAPANMSFHPIFHFRRLSIKRASAQVLYYRLLCHLKPQVIIVCTHELLLSSLYFKKKHGCRLVYDVRENYALNLTAQHNYNAGLKHLLALGVRKIEKAAATSISHYLVAEQSYLQELPFLTRNTTLVQNKYKPGASYTMPVTPVALPAGPLQLLYSGTIAELYGVFEAITFAEAVHQLRPGSTLTIIGYSARAETWHQVKKLAEGRPYIRLVGGDKLVPHPSIVQQIQQSDLGLLPYQPNASTFRCIPTKLYEYVAHALPVVVQANPLWQPIVARHAAGVSIDFRTCDVAALLQQLRQQQFYTTGVPAEAFWKEEEQKLLVAITPLLEHEKIKTS
ncbi:glycosyltransferase [Pontibacter liquoris]|uniref:glycosyltransferase n=1 Tax=Pontibacter liquoris TaxID=2905677 RepID=UPI001FA7AD1F|nr:glycosyltransferase [Pontibacter liquoris]